MTLREALPAVYGAVTSDDAFQHEIACLLSAHPATERLEDELAAAGHPRFVDCEYATAVDFPHDPNEDECEDKPWLTQHVQ
jgi:hypothetical protein